MKLSKALDLSPAYLQYGIEEIANMSQEAINFGIEYDKLSESEKKLFIDVWNVVKKKKDK